MFTVRRCSHLPIHVSDILSMAYKGLALVVVRWSGVRFRDDVLPYATGLPSGVVNATFVKAIVLPT